MAVDIQFPEEELDSEYALPVFDGPRNAVMNPRVTQKYKLNLSSSVFYRGDELFYFPIAFQVAASFFITEIHGAEFNAWGFIPGLSNIGAKFKNVANRDGGSDSFNATYAPYPRAAFFLNYRYSPFYGKISLSKKLVQNFHIGALIGAGAIMMKQVDQSQLYWAPAIQLQLDQKVYITKQIYLFGALNFHLFYGTNPVNKLFLNKDGGKRLQRCRSGVDSGCIRSSIFLRSFVGGGLGVLLF